MPKQCQRLAPPVVLAVPQGGAKHPRKWPKFEVFTVVEEGPGERVTYEVEFDWGGLFAKATFRVSAEGARVVKGVAVCEKCPVIVYNAEPVGACPQCGRTIGWVNIPFLLRDHFVRNQRSDWIYNLPLVVFGAATILSFLVTVAFHFWVPQYENWSLLSLFVSMGLAAIALRWSKRGERLWLRRSFINHLLEVWCPGCGAFRDKKTAKACPSCGLSLDGLYLCSKCARVYDPRQSNYECPHCHKATTTELPPKGELIV